MITEKVTSKSLMVSVLMGFVLIVAGELVKLTGNGESVLWLGILFLILSPLVAVVVSALSLSMKKEWKWVIVTIILVLVSIVGILIAFII